MHITDTRNPPSSPFLGGNSFFAHLKSDIYGHFYFFDTAKNPKKEQKKWWFPPNLPLEQNARFAHLKFLVNALNIFPFGNLNWCSPWCHLFLKVPQIFFFKNCPIFRSQIVFYSVKTAKVRQSKNQTIFEEKHFW